jgi:hypothetical protein
MLTDMDMDTWYDLRIEQIFDLTSRVNELLDDAADTDEDVAPGQRVCEPFDLTDRAADLLKEVQSSK